MQAIRADYFGSTAFASIMGWSQIIVTMGSIAGPVLAGVTLASAGPGWAFFVNFVSYGAVLAALALIDTAPRSSGRSGPIAPIRDFAETIRYTRTQPGIAAAIATVFR